MRAFADTTRVRGARPRAFARALTLVALGLMLGEAAANPGEVEPPRAQDEAHDEFAVEASLAGVAQVVSDLMQAGTESAGANRFRLTARELEIVAYITQGYTNRDLARALRISEETVKRHLTNIYNKVGMSNRLELALFAIEHGVARN